MKLDKTLDVLSRALSVIQESEGADEHAELISEMRDLLSDGEQEERDTPEELIDDEDLCDLVAEELGKLGIKAFMEHSGGGIYCVFVPTGAHMDGEGPGDGEWCFGMADEHWGGGWSHRSGGYFESTYLTTDVFSDEQDAKKIAAALAKVLNEQGAEKLANRGEAS